MKRKLFKAFLGLAAAASLLLTGCSGLLGGDVDESSYSSGENTRTSSDTVSYELNDDGTVTFRLGSTSPFDSIIKNSRTIAPENPTLYYTVYGATKSTGTGDALVADYATALTSGDVVTDVWYPTEANKTSGIEFTIGVSSYPWYFTAYGTYDSPASIIAGASATTETEKIAAIAEAAVVRGTLTLYLTLNDDGTITFKESATATEASDMVIATKSCSEEAGKALIPVHIDEYDATLNKADRKVKSIKLTLTQEGEATAFKTITHSLSSAGSEVNAAFNPDGLDSGTYDVYISVMNSDSKEIYYLEDKLYVLPNITSYVLKGGTDLTADVTYVQAITGDDTAGTSTATLGGTKTGYVITGAYINKFRRHVFYVTGTGGALTHVDDETGSMFAPFDTVKKAADAIGTNLADGTIGGTGIEESTDWRIIIDGAPSDAEAITFTNTSTSEGTLRILKYSGTAANTASTIPSAVNFTATVSAGTLRVCLANITLAGAVEIGIPDLYIKNTKFTGAVTLDKEDTYKNGIINALSTDTTSSASDITLQGSYGSTVVNHIDNTSTIDIDGDGEADAASAATDTFAASTTWSTQYVLNDDYINGLDDDTAADPSIRRVLEVGTDNADAGTLGDLIVKSYQNTLSISNENDKYAAYCASASVDLTTANVNSQAITLTYTVYGKNSSYPASGLNPLSVTYTLKTTDGNTIDTSATNAVTITAATPSETETSAGYLSKATGTTTIKLGNFSDKIARAESTETYVLEVSYLVGELTCCDTLYFTVEK